jgi:Ca2+-binding EF-hand superfamily protein
VHLDLFSDDKTLTINRLFADIDFDPTLLGDEDYDGVFDVSDDCLNTPADVPVDTVGCPFDDDNDGVPNYKDREPMTNKGAIVDEFGVTMPEDQLIAMIENNDAVKRSEVDLYILNYASSSQFRGLKDVKVPEKYKSVDKDNDGYISFEEVMEAIDNFFDFETDLSTEDIYELNDFFFSQ